jgi:hypothetical protein
MNKNKKEQLIEQLKEDSFETLDLPEVKSRLGHYATKLSEVVERSEFVDINPDGFLDIKGFRPTLVPIDARDIGEKASLHAKDSGMNLKQIDALVDRYGDPIQATQRSEALSQYFTQTRTHRQLPIFTEESGLAVTTNNRWHPTDEVAVDGRPLVSMNMNERVNGKFSPVVFLHEMTHVLQKEATPIRKVETYHRDNVRHELEAYYVAAQIIMGYKDAGRQLELLDHSIREQMDKARRIEEVRASYQSDTNDPFNPNNRVLKGLVDNKLAITGKLKTIIDKKT